jgi:hypothetical protein
VANVWDDYLLGERPYSEEIDLPGNRLLRGGSLLDDWCSNRTATRPSWAEPLPDSLPKLTMKKRAFGHLFPVKAGAFALQCHNLFCCGV